MPFEFQYNINSDDGSNPLDVSQTRVISFSTWPSISETDIT